MVFLLSGRKYHVVTCDAKGPIVRHFEWSVEGNIVYHRSGYELGKLHFETTPQSKWSIINSASQNLHDKFSLSLQNWNVRLK